MAEQPAARPSRPSARLTAFDQAVMRKFAQMMNRTKPIATPQAARSMLESRAKEMAVEAGVSPLRSAKLRPTTAKTMPMKACPTIFCQALRPRERCRAILAKSSMKPMRPSPTTRKSRSTPEARGTRISMRLATA